jgi:hypothetical protein
MALHFKAKNRQYKYYVEQAGIDWSTIKEDSFFRSYKDSVSNHDDEFYNQLNTLMQFLGESLPAVDDNYDSIFKLTYPMLSCSFSWYPSTSMVVDYVNIMDSVAR